MRQGRHGIKVLGLSLIAALGLMAFTAAAAQAGEYTLEGSSFTSKALASETVSGTIAAGKLLVPGLELTFVCTGGTASGSVLLGGVAHANILFSGCTVEGNKICKVYETKATMEGELEANRGFIAASGLGELVLMGGKHYLLVSSGASAFATIYLTRESKGCLLPLENSVTGSTVFSLPNALTAGGLSSQTLGTILQKGAEGLETLWSSDVLSYGNQTAWLDEGGSTNLALTGTTNKNKKWGAE